MGKSINEYTKMSSNKKEELNKKSINGLYVILGIGVLLFYLIPLLIGIYIGAEKDVYNYSFIYINTVYCFVACYVHAFKYGFRWYAPVSIGLFFIPSCLVFRYLSIAPLALVYAVLGFFGDFTGYLMYRHKIHKLVPLGMGRSKKHKNKK